MRGSSAASASRSAPASRARASPCNEGIHALVGPTESTSTRRRTPMGSRGEASIAIPPPHECPSKSQRAIPNASRMATTSPASYSMRESRTAGGSSLAPRPRWWYRMSWRPAASGASAGQSSACEYNIPPLMHSSGGAPATSGDENTANSRPRAATVRRVRRGARPDARLGVAARGGLEGGNRPGIPAIAEGDGGVAREPAAFRAGHRARSEARAPFFVAEGEQLGRVGIHATAARLQRRLGEVARESHVPGTHVLADVTAVQELADGRSELQRDLTLQFDREVGDAACGVEHARGGEGLRRTGVEAARAGAAAIGFERCVGLQLRVGEQGADEEERAEARIDQVRVLAEPAKARTARKVAFEHWSGVHERAGARLAVALGNKPAAEFVELRAHHLVIVVAAGVSRDRAGWLRATVVHRDDDRGSQAGLRTTGVAAQFRGALEIVHLAGVAAGEPGVELARGVGQAKARDAGEVESETQRLRCDLGGARGRR